MRGRPFFVTGSDTDAGKTWVTARLAELCSSAGVRVAALKAAESGCSPGAQGLVATDDARLFEAAGSWQPERCRYRFQPAVAPGVAADDLDLTIDFELIMTQVETLAEVADLVLVEGAGGWLVPMGRRRTIEDLARRLGAPVIVVGRARLGTINHVALTVRAVRTVGLPVARVILSQRPDDDRELARRNAEELTRMLAIDVRVLDGSDADRAVADELLKPAAR